MRQINLKSYANMSDDIKVPEKFKKLVEEIEKMSVIDLAELVKVLEKKLGVLAQAPVMAFAPPSAGGAAAPPAAETKTSFNVILKDAGAQKIAVIKLVKDITGKGLKEAKDMVDAPPQTLKENTPKEEAEKIKKDLEAAGAKIELQ